MHKKTFHSQVTHRVPILSLYFFIFMRITLLSGCRRLCVSLSKKKMPEMMLKRSTPEIMAEILSLCRTPQCKTKIMYKTCLSWEMLQRYLPQLESQGLLEVHHSEIRYATTPKGLRFVEKWRELEEI